MTWQQIKQADRTRLGCEFIPKSQVKPCVTSSPGLQDLEDVLVFRIDEGRRMLGYRTEATFHVLAVDEDLSTYSHG